MRAMRQRAAAVLRPGAGPPSTDAEEEAAEVLAQLKVLQARGAFAPGFDFSSRVRVRSGSGEGGLCPSQCPPAEASSWCLCLPKAWQALCGGRGLSSAVQAWICAATQCAHVPPPGVVYTCGDHPVSMM